MSEVLMPIYVINGTLSTVDGLQGTLSMPQERDVPTYEGEYSVVPQAHDAQVLPTAGMKMLDNVIVAAIPNNYGKITWDGIRLTVS